MNYDIDKEIPLANYIKHKIFMLEREFKLNLTFEDIEHFKSLKTKNDVDRFAHTIIMERL